VARRLTIHSSRRRFAARLNSGVRAYKGNILADGTAIVILAILVLGGVWVFRKLADSASGFLAKHFYRSTTAWIFCELFLLAMFWFLCDGTMNGISTHEIHCFGRRCRTTYSSISEPIPYWLTIFMWLAAAILTVWVSLRLARRHAKYQASKP